MARTARMTRTTTVAAALVALVLASPAQAASPPPVVSRGVTIPAFYSPPATLPARNGALVRYQPFRLAVRLPGIDGPLPGRPTRILYTTTDSTGRRVAVSGAYLEPAAPWRGPGPRPLVVVAPGTMGQGDQCSASLGLQYGLVAGTTSISVGYENVVMYNLLSRGVAVVETDYVGLGTTDRLHTYVNRVDGAHAVLDAARAALSLPGTSLTRSTPVGLYGYSQGGGAAAAAAELAAGYAPGLKVRATYAGAPPADLAAVTASIDGTELTGALGWAVNGFVQSDPGLRPLLDTYVNAAGRAALKDLSTRCVGDAILEYGYSSSGEWLSHGGSLARVIAAEPRLRTFVARQKIGNGTPTGAVRLATAVHDDLVQHAQARTLAVTWCRRGADVTYVPIDVPELLSPLLNHFVPLLDDQDDAVTWMTQRLAGRPAASNCAAVPRMR